MRDFRIGKNQRHQQKFQATGFQPHGDTFEEHRVGDLSRRSLSLKFVICFKAEKLLFSQVSSIN